MIMRNIIKSIHVLWFFVLWGIHICYSAFWIDKVEENLKGSDDINIWTTIQEVILYTLWFLALIAVIFSMKWGFQILTAGWDEEKVKSWKKTVLYMLLWLFVIIIAWALVSWLLWWIWEVNNEIKKLP